MTKKYLTLLAIFSLTIAPFASKTQVISSIAGTFNGDGNSSTSIGLNPVGQVVDAAGNMFIAVPDRHIVMKISVAGIVSTIAGNGIFGFSGDGGLATAAQLKNPWGVAVDAAGNVFIADNLDNRIRKVTPGGIITTIAGTATGGFTGDGGPAVSAQLRAPTSVAIDAAGNIFIADYANKRVRKIATNGIINTIAGTGVSGIGGDGGPATCAQLGFISAIAFNTAGHLFIADNTNSKVRKVDLGGIITTVAGNGVQGFGGDGGLATAANFSAINGVALDRSGNLFIADSYNNRIRKVNTSGIVSTVAGNGGGSFSGDGALATSAQIYRPTCVAIDLSDNILISNTFRIRRVTVSNGIINTITGNGTGGYCGDGGTVAKAQLYHPMGVGADASGNIFIVDREGHRIRKLSSTGVMTTIAGTGTAGFSGDGGPATSAQLNFPSSVVVDQVGNVYITDVSNKRIRKIAANGTITTIAGTGTGGFNGDGLASSAQLWGPDGITMDATGNIFFADQYNNRIRKITAAGVIVTIAGTGVAGFKGDGGPAILAQLNYPNNVKVDKAGNVFFTDRKNNRVRKISTLGIITTMAGNGTQPFNGDNKNAVLASLDPAAIAIDTSGNIFIADSYNERIRRVNASGIITTLAGGGATYGDGGSASAAQAHTPTGIASDPTATNLYITDYDNHRIRKISLAGVILGRNNNSSIISNVPTSPLKFSMYPNPVENTLYIQTPEAGGIVYVEIMDAAGKILLSRPVGTSQSVIAIQLQKLTPGIYFVRTTGKDKNITVKEILKK